MNKEEALIKIEKCLRLSKSSNEHEAANALNQAQALMHQFNLTQNDVMLAGIKETEVNCTRCDLALWKWDLVNCIASAFGVGAYKSNKYDGSNIVFYGFGIKSEMAGYAFEVLLRQLKYARRRYIASDLKRVRIQRNKQFRANEFCRGWVRGVQQKVDKFANPAAEEDALVAYHDKKNCKTAKIKAISVSKAVSSLSIEDWRSGMVASSSVSLNHAMCQTQTALIKGK